MTTEKGEQMVATKPLIRVGKIDCGELPELVERKTRSAHQVFDTETWEVVPLRRGNVINLYLMLRTEVLGAQRAVA